MASSLDRDGDFALVLEGIPRDAAGQKLTLVVDKLNEKCGIFVIDMLDTELAEAAVFLPLGSDFRITEKFYIVS